MSKMKLVIASVLLAGVFVVTSAYAAGSPSARNVALGDTPEASWAPLSLLATDVVAKAQPDECYVGLGETNLYPFDFGAETCTDGMPKVSESYVFGLTRSGDELWFGTAPNMGCLVYGEIASQAPIDLTPFETSTWTCEYGEGLYAQPRDIPPASGDWRPPSTYTYDLETGELERKDIGDPLLEETLGLRSAGASDELILLAGPQITSVGGSAEDPGINVFAFNAATGAYLGSKRLVEFNDIRKWVTVEDRGLYTGVAVNLDEFQGNPDVRFGAVLRWTGDLADPFQYEIVGWLTGEAAEVVEHQGRIFSTTWPDFDKLEEDEYDYAGLWMSPLLGEDGLNPSDASGWEQVWASSDYEQDEVAARMYNGGALASYQGFLYWGSLHAPMSAGLAHALVYGFIDEDDPTNVDIGAVVKAVQRTHRPINIFRGWNFGTEEQGMEVLYGQNVMWAYVESPWPWGPARIWRQLPNKMGLARFGEAGFGNPWNTYTWTMAVQGGRLYVGTMDWSHTFAAVMLPVFLQNLANPLPDVDIAGATYGADLYVFPSATEPAVTVDLEGVRNFGTYGVRTMQPTEDGLFMGMANAMNLMVDTTDDLPEGGWELILLRDAQCDTTGVPGDLDGDGEKTWAGDFPVFQSCTTAACTEDLCPLPFYEDECCVADFDRDGDVDLTDFWFFLVS
jgi:hypothetical protein